MSETRSCKYCKFSGTILSGNKEILMVCRRNPPSVAITPVQTREGIAMNTTTAWPMITNDDWCGEHEPSLNS